MALSKTEEQLMEIIWHLDGAFMKDIMEQFSEPFPSNSTVLTLLKRMQDKGYVGFETLGNSRKYFALVPKEEHFGRQVNGLIKDFFNDSPLQFASFFTKSSNLSEEQLLELKKIIDDELKKKQS